MDTITFGEFLNESKDQCDDQILQAGALESGKYLMPPLFYKDLENYF